MFGRLGFGGLLVTAVVWFVAHRIDGPGMATAVAAVTAFLVIAFRVGKAAERKAKKDLPRAHARTEPRLEDPTSKSGPQTSTPHSRQVHAEEADINWAAEWQRKVTTITIQGRAISSSMYYFGKRMASLGSARPDPALVDPRLAVNFGWPDYAGSTLRHWPSYSELSAEARAAYLDWLNTGRSDPGTNIGFVFLFFYGLERRILHDALQVEAIREELPELVAELQRLLAIYGPRSDSFDRYCTQLLDAVEVLFRRTPIYLTRPRAISNTGEFPTIVRVALAQASSQGEPIPASWALAWYLSDPETRLRTPATRCPAELSKLFHIRYDKAFSEGLVVKPNKTQLIVRYKPASTSFGSELTLPLPPLPDVSILSGPRKRIAAIADECMDALDPFSRRIGQDPERTLTTLALLPPELMTNVEHDGVGQLREWTARVSSTGFTVAGGAELLALWSSKPGEAMAKKEAVGLAQMLDTLGVGIEPDIRFGGSPPNVEEPVVLFRQEAASPAAASSAYTAATLLLRLGVSVAMADGVLSPAEEDFLENHVASVLQLSAGEKQRLRAHLKWLLTVQPTLTGLKKRLESVDAPRRRALAQFVVAAAGADGRIEPSEVKSLAKIFKQLGFEESELHRELHNLSASQAAPANEPVTVKAGGKSRTDFSIPGPPGKQTPSERAATITLDTSKIEAKLAETAKVSALLADIFTEEEPLPSTASAVKSPPTLSGLDASLTSLLLAVQRETEESGVLSRAQFEALCASLKLMPDGALDRLNEAAFDRADAPLLEGEETLEINHQALKEMTA